MTPPFYHRFGLAGHYLFSLFRNSNEPPLSYALLSIYITLVIKPDHIYINIFASDLKMKGVSCSKAGIHIQEHRVLQTTTHQYEFSEQRTDFGFEIFRSADT
jgi:hypothetical protein